MNVPLLLASFLTLVTWGIHTFVGGPTVARPLLESAMEPVAKLTNYYCWHVVTVTLLAISAAYGLAAVVASFRNVAVFVTLLAAAYSAWSLLLLIRRGRNSSELPQWIIFGVIAGVATLGL